ncbi:MAG: short chain dehydrogenase [Gammaproteobacteria bacterium]|nr:MAG: short chain dehydrogenase [Gammaproteobacteria bacterium]
MTSLSGQKVVVVGGSSGMGLGCAKAAVDAGAEVVIVSRNREKLTAAADKLGSQAAVFSVDVQKEDEVQNLFAELGSLDHLVVTASATAGGPFLKMETAMAKNFFDTKFWGAYFCAKYAAPNMSKSGSITFVSGVSSRRPMKGLAPAGACNGALESLSKALALELKPIRVNTISPGLVDTPLYDMMPEERRDGMFEATAKILPVGRIGQPEDIGNLAISLMSNGFISGTTLDIDGGNMIG